MARAFERIVNHDDLIFVSEVDPAECAILIHAFDELIDLLTLDTQVDETSRGDDPIFDQLGLSEIFDQTAGAECAEPKEPMSARLFPPGYVGDTGQAHDFRRFTEPELRKQKIDNARLINRTLAAAAGADPPQIVLGVDEVTPWLRSINDLRLTIAVQVGIGEPDELDRLANPAIQTVRELYDFLTWWQGSLLEVLS
ncbi:MAG: DUF2017 family protein [Candidatus Nanopelagicales bacterium]